MRNKIYMILITFGFASTIFWGCSPQAHLSKKAESFVDTIYIRTDEYEGMIFNNYYKFNYKDFYEYCNIDENDIKLAERILKDTFIKKSNKIWKTKCGYKKYKFVNLFFRDEKYIRIPDNMQYYNLINKLCLYKRQYFGCYNKKGQKIIYINCLIDNDISFLKWREGHISVLDGGDYYWQIKINLDKKKCFDFQVNGN